MRKPMHCKPQVEFVSSNAKMFYLHNPYAPLFESATEVPNLLEVFSNKQDRTIFAFKYNIIIYLQICCVKWCRNTVTHANMG